MAFRYAHIFVAGFTHRVANGGNGVIEVHDETYARYAGPETLVEYYPWYISAREIALRIAQLNEDCLAEFGEPLLTQLVGYSFGGQTVADVLRHLIDLRKLPAVTVNRVTLCDAVARWGRLGWLRAANPLGTIRLPHNVDRLTAFVQRHPRWQLRPPLFHPRGHRLFRDDDPLPLEPIVLDAQHTEIDNHPDFHDAVLSDAAELHAGDTRRAKDNVQADILPFPNKAA